ncbi:MAG: hypothetical protein A2Z81_02195 [Omnitrophica WOR_2 bacterium GWA2_45_18]|nr:MAG: hypothetical protein A2Z81_02195 [Omnitrophica WOR_2 bacterium GWA2_45_18]
MAVNHAKSRPILMEDSLMERYSLFIRIGGALLAILLAVNFLYNDSPDHAHILRMSGAVLIERADEKITPKVGMFLNAQDKITTDDGSFVEVAYDDMRKDVMRIGANSRVVLESARIKKQTNLFMDKGEIMLKLNQLEKGSTFEVRTPVAIAGVRGTAFGVQFKGKQVVITDYESRIFVKGLTEDFVEMKDELLLDEGWKVQVAQFEKPSRVKRLTAEEHAAWQAWLNTVDSLPRSEAVNNVYFVNLAHAWGALLQKPLTLLTTMIMNMTSSASILAFMLYAVLALGTHRIIERVWL